MHLLDLQGSYNGRVFIVGTGPSLASVSSWDKVSPIFGCNKLLYWDDAPETRFYACNYETMLQDVRPDPHPTDHRFLVGSEDDYEAERYLDWPDWVWVTKRREPDALGAMTLICAQICYVLGFREMYLLGCDQTDQGSIFSQDDYRLKGRPEEEFPDVLPLWQTFYEEFNKSGGRLYDCSGGRLGEVLPTKSLGSVIDG